MSIDVDIAHALQGIEMEVERMNFGSPDDGEVSPMFQLLLDRLDRLAEELHTIAHEIKWQGT